MTDVRERAVRTLILTVAIAIMSIAAILLLIAAAAVALASWVGLVPALLSMAGVVTIFALVLVLLARHRPRRRSVGLLGGVPAKHGDLPNVGPLAIVAIGLAAGLFLGLRGTR